MNARAAQATTEPRDRHPLLRRRELPASAAGTELAGLADMVARGLRATLRESGLSATLAFGEALGRHEPLGGVFDRLRGRAIAALFDSGPAANGGEPHVLPVLIEHSLVLAMTEGLLGGDGCEPPFRATRALTRIELRIARLLAERAGRALSASLEGRLSGALRLTTVETNFDYVEAGPRETRVVELPLSITLLGQEGTLLALLPEHLVAAPVEAGTPVQGEDRGWTERFGAQVSQADLVLSARFETRAFSLGDVASWRPGARLSIGHAARLLLDCDGRPIFSGELGQSEGHYALKIEDKASEAQIRSTG